jgi:hypothetical protein
VIFIAEQIKHEITNAPCLAPIVLQQIELRSRRIVQCHNFAVDDCTVRQIDKSFDYVRVLLIERLLTTGEQVNFVIGLDRNRPISIKFDLFCGDERYVALTLIGDLAKRNFTEMHHII